jgi:hypothetical protein
MVFMTTALVNRWTTFQEITTRDGITWSEPKVLFEGVWGVSPALAKWDGKWCMWSVHMDTSKGFGNGVVQVRTRDRDGTFGSTRTCAMSIPGYLPWHLDVVAMEDRVLALVAAARKGGDSSRTWLFLLESRDGRTFSLLKPGPILGPSLTGWDNRMIYRSSLCPLGDGNWRLYYSASSWGKRFGLGLLEGPLDRLEVPSPLPCLQPLSLGLKAREDLLGLAKRIARKRLPWLRRFR